MRRLAADPVQGVRRQCSPGAEQRARQMRYRARTGRDQRRPWIPRRHDALEKISARAHSGGVVDNKQAVHAARVGSGCARAEVGRRRWCRGHRGAREKAVRVPRAPRLVRRKRADNAEEVDVDSDVDDDVDVDMDASGDGGVGPAPSNVAAAPAPTVF